MKWICDYKLKTLEILKLQDYKWLHTYYWWVLQNVSKFDLFAQSALVWQPTAQWQGAAIDPSCPSFPVVVAECLLIGW